ncbi:MAG: transposase [Acidobacteriota bacterium]|jgi:transposase
MITSVFAVQSERFFSDGHTEKEIRYFMTNLPKEKLEPKRLLYLVREHWSIENRLHHIKDRSWNEDKHYLSKGNIGEMFSGILSIALNCLRLWFKDKGSFVQRAYYCADNFLFTCKKFRGT